MFRAEHYLYPDLHKMPREKALKAMHHLQEQIETILPAYYNNLLDVETDVETCRTIINERNDRMGAAAAELSQIQDYLHMKQPEIVEKRGDHKRQKIEIDDETTPHHTFTSIDHKHRAEDVDSVQRLFAQLSTITPEELDKKAKRNKEGQQKNDKEVEKERKNQPQPEPRNNLYFQFSIPSPEKLPDDIRYAILRTTGGVVEIISLRTLYCLSPLIQRLYWCDTKQTVFLVPQVQLLVLPLIAEVVRWFHEEEPLKTAMTQEGDVELKGDVFFPLFMAFYKKRIWTSGCMERYVKAFAQAVNYLEMPRFLSTEAQWAADYYCSLDHP